MIPSVSYEISNDDLMLEEDDLGEVRIVNNEFTVKANVKIFSKESIDTIQDAYSPSCLIGLKKDEYEVGILQGTNACETIVKDNIQLNENNLKPEQIISSNATVILTDKEVTTDKVIVEGIIKTDLLYKTNNEDKCMADIKSEIPFSASVDVSGTDNTMKAIVRGNLENLDAVIEGNTIAIKAVVTISAKICYEIKKEFISDVVEEDGEKPEKKASITIYVVGKGDTLWELAKHYNTTIKELMNINNLEENSYLEEGKKLIIPGRAIF